MATTTSTLTTTPGFTKLELRTAHGVRHTHLPILLRTKNLTHPTARLSLRLHCSTARSPSLRNPPHRPHPHLQARPLRPQSPRPANPPRRRKHRLLLHHEPRHPYRDHRRSPAPSLSLLPPARLAKGARLQGKVEILQRLVRTPHRARQPNRVARLPGSVRVALRAAV
jgi:hypothetical protein